MVSSLPRLLLLGGLLLAGSPLLRAAEGDTASELKQVQEQIKQKTRELKQQQRQQQVLTRELQAAEKQVADTAAALHKIDKDSRANQQRQAALGHQADQLEQQKQQQQAVLGNQLASAYMSGRHDLAQLLLNQQQSSKMERLLGYYQFLTQARVEALESLKQTLTELDKVAAELETKRRELAQLAQEQQQRQLELQQQQQQRQTTLAKLKQQYRSNSEALEQMQLSEAELKNLLAQASSRVRQFEAMEGLEELKGQLDWPVDGRLSNRFGNIRQGQLRWKGILIRGQEGQPVKAVQHGQILFSDWIKGFGLVLVMDHGDGYMSLYGHNQALLKQAGDMVARNEVIALVGRSGGQSQPGLYFEIRHKGRAVNPARWCRR